MSSNLHNTSLIAAAIGATVGVISAASVFIYQKVLERRHQRMMYNNLENVNRRIVELQSELENLRSQQSQQQKLRKRRALRKHTTTTTSDTTMVTANGDDTDIDAYSIVGTDVGDDEYFDCSDSDGGAGDFENGPVADDGCNVDPILAELDRQAENEELYQEVYDRLKLLANADPNNVEIIWRLARSCSNSSHNTVDPPTKEIFIVEGLKACERVVDLEHADLHKWYAILLGMHSDFLPVKGKISNGYKFKEHLTKALQLRPDDSTLYYLLGRFKFEVSGLSWIERKIASTLFDEPPTASYQEAIDDFEKAESMAKKPLLENRLYLGKAYIAQRQIDKAVHWLKMVSEMRPHSDEEERCLNEANELLNKYA